LGFDPPRYYRDPS